MNWLLLGTLLIGWGWVAYRLKHAAHPITDWQRPLQKHLLLFNELYEPVNGFLLSKVARKDQDDLELVYGEIDFYSFIALLHWCQPDAKTVFYDLGSGTGKAVLSCAMIYEVNEAHGIELLAPLHECAKAQVQRLTAYPQYQAQAAKIHFHQGDFLTVDFHTATLIFINATAFFVARWQQISEYIAMQVNH